MNINPKVMSLLKHANGQEVVLRLSMGVTGVITGKLGICAFGYRVTSKIGDFYFHESKVRKIDLSAEFMTIYV